MGVEAFDPDFLADLQFIRGDGSSGAVRRRAEAFADAAFAVGDFFADLRGING